MQTSLQNCRVLVTPTSYAKYDPTLKTRLEEEVGEVIYNPSNHPLSAELLIDLIQDVDGYIAGLDEVTNDVLATANKLKVIARYGVGVDNIDLKAAARKGIVITNTPSANALSVAELTVGLMIALARNIPEAVVLTRSGNWPRLSGTLLTGKTIGLIGYGAIGRCVAKLLGGFDCQILVYDPYINTQNEITPQVDCVDRDFLVINSDFISLHCPSTPETTNLINAEFLTRMKPGSFIVNTARGDLVDEGALFESLVSGHLRGAALDVFSKQPLNLDNPLIALDKVILTPHTGAHTDGAANEMGWRALNDCLAVLRGHEPENRVI
jgi:D-3-phosphoglycerate dehydrogenase